MRLLERTDALDVLHVAHGSAAVGEGRVVVITGDAGIGKTVLVAEYLSAEPTGRVVRGGADDLSTPLPLGALRDVARQASPVLEQAITDGLGRDGLFPLLIDELERRPLPVVMVIEDAHWADEATIDLLTLIGRRIESMSVLIILTYRDHEVGAGHPLRSMIGHLPVGAVERIALEPLTESAVAELIPDRDPSEVMGLTGGNPFFVAALASGEGSSSTIGDVVMRRITRLGEQERSLCELLSVAPGGLSGPVLETVMPDWIELAPAGERAGLLAVSDGQLAYRHEIARHAVEESLPDVSRLGLHTRLVAAMRQTGADPAEIVHHAELAGDDGAVAEFADAAAAAAMAAGAHREAVEHLGRIIRTSKDADPGLLALHHEQYASEAWAANQASTSAEGAFAARAAYRVSGDPEGAARAGRLAARATWYFGDTDQALDLIDAALAELAPMANATAERARALAYRSLVGGIGRGPSEIEPYATDALALLDQPVDDETMALVLNNVATARSRHGTHSDDLLQRALVHAERAGAATEYVRVMANRAVEAVNARRGQHAGEALEAALADAEARQVLAFHPFMKATHAQLALDTGEWVQAEAAARWVLSDDVDAGFARLPARTVVARLAVRRGERSAKASVGALWQDALATGEFQSIGPAAAVMAEHALLRDRPDDIATALAEAGAVSEPGALPYVAAELAAWARRSDATVAFAAGTGPHAIEADGDWRQAAEAWDELGYQHEASMVRAWWGEESDMLAALDALDRSGAAGTASWLRARMRAAGIKRVPKGPSEATRQNPAGLTKRQIDVLMLVADGLTNAEIADELYLSTRTVDHHVSAVLMKLQVTSRRHAAQKVSELGLR